METVVIALCIDFEFLFLQRPPIFLTPSHRLSGSQMHFTHLLRERKLTGGKHYYCRSQAVNLIHNGIFVLKGLSLLFFKYCTVNSRLSGGRLTSLQISCGKKIIHNKKLKLFLKIIFEKRRAHLRNRLF
jgi:hypothetical protein